MANPFEADWSSAADFQDVEALVRAAGQYVRPSEDFRPRVLEAARLHCGERWMQRCVRRLAMIVVLMVFVTSTDEHGLDVQRPQSAGMLAAAGFDEFCAPMADASPRSGDGDWRMIEAFTELRRQQSQLLRLSM